MTRDELYERLNDIILGCGGDVDDAMEHVDSYAATQRAEIAQAIEAKGFDPGRYTLTHPFGNSLRVMQLVCDDCARIARAEQ